MASTLPAIAIMGEPIPKLPRTVTSLIDSTGSWNEQAGCLVGWKKPATLPPGMPALLRLWIPKMRDALAPMTRAEPVKMALVRLHAILPGRQADTVQVTVWLEAMLQHLRPFPERAVLEALAEIERKSKWRPSPVEILAVIERDIAGPRDELKRMEWLSEIGDRPAITAQVLRPFEQWSDAEKAKHETLMSSYRAGVPESVSLRLAPKAARRYLMVEASWERHLIDAWMLGYDARRRGDIPADCPLREPEAKHLWTEGNLVAAGVACRDVTLAAEQKSIIDDWVAASKRVDVEEYDNLPAA